MHIGIVFEMPCDQDRNFPDKEWPCQHFEREEMRGNGLVIMTDPVTFTVPLITAIIFLITHISHVCDLLILAEHFLTWSQSRLRYSELEANKETSNRVHPPSPALKRPHLIQPRLIYGPSVHVRHRPPFPLWACIATEISLVPTFAQFSRQCKPIIPKRAFGGI